MSESTAGVFRHLTNKPPVKARYDYANPWRITPAEERTLNKVIEAGGGRKAADALGLSPKTIEAQLAVIKKKMGRQSRLHVLIDWDRWNRE